jgi:hypothetical protein
MTARLCWLLLVLSPTLGAQILQLENGHAKGQYLASSFPDDSLFRDYIDNPAQDLNGELRLILAGRENRWSWQGDYQVITRRGDTLELSRALAQSPLVSDAVPSDDRRLMDLTQVIFEHDDWLLAHRLDRFHVAYTGDKTVLRAGRQAVSWGNGLIYNPVDFFNPFDPSAVDKEFKSGDDMLYGQYLQDSGNDWQAVSVWRRDDSRDTGSAQNTTALKYHAFIGEQELDLLAARHYRDDIFSVGGVSSLGGAIIRGDLVFTDTDNDRYVSAVANLTYSWVAFDKNVSGVIEYFYNDMGLHDDDYDQLEQSEDLISRISRGELYTVGRHYLAGGVTVELSPLLLFTPNVFLNLLDQSGLTQLVMQYDLAQNWQLLVAANFPFGSNGTEYGGLDTPVEGKQLSTGPGLFTQIALYF